MLLRVNLPDELRQKRERLNLTQVDLAERLGVSPRTVQGWEAGAVTPQPKHRRVLSDFLDDDVEDAA